MQSPEITKQEEERLRQDRDDQFLLAEALVGGNPFVFPDCINSRRYVRFIRNLRRHGSMAEGELAARCGERMFLPEWQPMIDWFVKQGWVALTPGKVGRALTVTLTDKGEEWCAFKLGPKEPVTEPQSTE